MLLKQKSPSFLRNLALRTFGKLLTVFSTKVNLLYLFYWTDSRCCLLHLIKQSFLLKTFLRILIWMTGVSLPVFPSRTNLKLHNIFIILKMVKRVIMNLALSKRSSPDCIPLVVLKNCDPELSYILAELCNMCVRKSLVFQNFGWWSYQWSLCLRTLEKHLLLKTTTLLVFFLWSGKSLKNLWTIGLFIT